MAGIEFKTKGEDMGKRHICNFNTNIADGEEGTRFANEVKDMCKILCDVLDNSCRIKVDIIVENNSEKVNKSYMYSHH